MPAGNTNSLFLVFGLILVLLVTLVKFEDFSSCSPHGAGQIQCLWTESLELGGLGSIWRTSVNYTGDFNSKTMKRSGQGVLEIEHGLRYDGKWEDNLPEGTGRLHLPFGQVVLDGIWSSGLPQLETPFNLQFDPLTCQASLVAKAPVNGLHFRDWRQLSWKGPLVRTGDHFDLGSSCQDEPSFSMQFTQRHTLMQKGLWEALVGGSDPDFHPIDHTFKMVLSDFGDPVTNSTPPVVKISDPEWSWMYERTSSSSSSSSLQISGLALLSSQAPSLAEAHLPFFYVTPPERLRRYYQTFSLDQLRAALSLLGQEPSSDLDAEQLILAIQGAPLHLGPFLIIRIVELYADLIKILIPDNTLWLVSGHLSSFNHSEPSDLLLLTEFFSAVVCALKTLPRVSHLLDTLPASALHFA